MSSEIEPTPSTREYVGGSKTVVEQAHKTVEQVARDIESELPAPVVRGEMLLETLKGHVRSRPIAAIAIAALAGLVLGRLIQKDLLFNRLPGDPTTRPPPRR